MSTTRMIAVLMLLMVGLVSSDINCPDGHQCTDESTCCKTSSGYECCPYPSAVCCDDQTHCCPNGYTCDTQSGQCKKQGLPLVAIPLLKRVPAKKPQSPMSSAPVSESVNVSVVHCDNQAACPDGTTCCKAPSGIWYCCPLPMAQCCSDGTHCCPHGYHCDPTLTRCQPGGLSLPASPHLPSPRVKTTKDRCCLTETGCCPSGFHCDEAGGSCVSDTHEGIPMTPLVQATDGKAASGVIRCDGSFFCPAKYSCCQTPSGKWGCCPYQLGQCCKDGKHCCEYGYTCGDQSDQCLKGYFRIPAGQRKKAQFL
ncbi:progranulin-like [Chanos chanos]|uniref:Progranulin-like n=1 Tax=Chanos chanos TaxID=29144 RepID=A0A6J2WI89_CHACN|nr:progranulin-like [Chanos chanos]